MGDLGLGTYTLGERKVHGEPWSMVVRLVRARCEPRARPERVGRRAAARRERAAEPRPGPAREMSQAGWPSARLGLGKASRPSIGWTLRKSCSSPNHRANS